MSEMGDGLRDKRDGEGDGEALVRYLVALPANPQTSGVLRRMLAKLKMNAMSSTEIAAISTHMIDWYGCVGSKQFNTNLSRFCNMQVIGCLTCAETALVQLRIDRIERIAYFPRSQVFQRLQVVVPERNFVLWIRYSRKCLFNLVVFQLILRRRLPLVAER